MSAWLLVTLRNSAGGYTCIFNEHVQAYAAYVLREHIYECHQTQIKNISVPVEDTIVGGKNQDLLVLLLLLSVLYYVSAQAYLPFVCIVIPFF